jgi:hypothetical protein
MSLLMSGFLGALALTVVLATFYVMRSWSEWLGRARVRRAPGGWRRPRARCAAGAARGVQR